MRTELGGACARSGKRTRQQTRFSGVGYGAPDRSLCCSRCFLIVENALASSQNALANIQNALASSQNALGSCENALVNSEDAPVNCENAIVNGETPLQNSENACRNGTKRIPSPIVLQVLFFLIWHFLRCFIQGISGHCHMDRRFFMKNHELHTPTKTNVFT